MGIHSRTADVTARLCYLTNNNTSNNDPTAYPTRMQIDGLELVLPTRHYVSARQLKQTTGKSLEYGWVHRGYHWLANPLVLSSWEMICCTCRCSVPTAPIIGDEGAIIIFAWKLQTQHH